MRLFSDPAGANEVARETLASDLAVAGTDVAFADVEARSVRVEIDDVSGTFYGIELASLAEIEVVAKGVE